MRTLSSRLAVSWVLAAAMLLGPARAQAEEVPPKLGLLLLLKVLSYDANLDAHVAAGAEFVVLVPFVPAQAALAKELLAVAAGLEVDQVSGRKLRFESVPQASLEATAASAKASAVLVLQGSPTELVEAVQALGAKKKLYTLALEEAPVKSGIALGVTLNNAKPLLLVNVPSAHAVGASFNTAVMRVARLFQ